MNRLEIIARNPLVPWLQARRIELFQNNTRAKRCPCQEHSRKDAVHITGEVWHCHVCGIGGSVIDWLMHELGVSVKDSIESLSVSVCPPISPPPRPHAPAAASEVVATYTYMSATGEPLYEVLRWEPGRNGDKKSFTKRRPNGKGGWISNVDGVAPVLYHLPELAKAQTVWLVEGEKDVHTMEQLGFVATTGDGGANNFKADVEPLKGKDVILCGDNDPVNSRGERPGETYIQTAADKLNGVAKSVSRVHVPAPAKDVTEYVDTFGDDTIAAEACRMLSTEAEVIFGPLLRKLLDLKKPEKNDPNELIRHRWLCKGALGLFVAPSGIGKSSFIMQCSILWTLGRDAFGMTPTRPLKIVIVQAENDDGDMAEMRDGVIAGMGLTEDEIEIVLNVIEFRTEFAVTGTGFCKLVARVLKESKADIIIIDPVLAYLGGAMNDQETVGAWLRNHLMPVCKVYNAGAILVHHTNKPPSGKEKPDWKGDDYSYLGGGSAEFTNACRFVLAMRSIGVRGVYELIAAKRGGRLGWRNEAGDQAIYTKRIAHSKVPGVICWYEVKDGEEGSDIEAHPTMAEYLAIFPDQWNKGPREALLTGRELRKVFVVKGWPYQREPGIRADAIYAGSLQQAQGDRTEKLIGKPEAIKALQS